MVCIGGKPINQGGCGSSVTKGCKIKEDGAKEQIEIKDNDMIIFKDAYPSANSNHQFDGESVESWADTIYEMRGAGGGKNVLQYLLFARVVWRRVIVRVIQDQQLALPVIVKFIHLLRLK